MSEPENEGVKPPDVADEDLPEDLQPTDDNPLAQDPDDSDAAEQPKQPDDETPPAGR